MLPFVLWSNNNIPAIPYLLKTLLKWILLLSTFHKTVIGQHFGPAYKSTGRHCSYDNQCIESVGEVCWWFYDGCSHGQCMCDPRTHFLDAAGKCRKARYGGETCYSGDSCPKRMQCRNGKCQCVDNRDMKMTDDGRFCLRQYEKLVGQSCNAKTDLCFQATVAGYNTKMVACVGGQCKCKPGFKEVGSRCRKLNIEEGSCSRDHHCQGGALCVERRCMCPSGYFPVAGNSKCAKNGAQFDLGVGSNCDEVNEERYCAQGLVCHRCPNDNQYTCVKYKESQTYNSALVGAGVDRTATIVCVLLGVIGAMLFMIISSS